MNLQFQKVIEGLQHHVDNADCVYWKDEGNEIIPACPYYDDEDNGEPFCETKLLLDAIGIIKDQDSFNRWLAHLVAHEDNEGGAEAEIICRKLAEMGYVSVKDGCYKEVFSEDEDERDA